MHDVWEGPWVGVMNDWFEVSMHGHDGHATCKGREDWVQSLWEEMGIWGTNNGQLIGLTGTLQIITRFPTNIRPIVSPSLWKLSLSCRPLFLPRCAALLNILPMLNKSIFSSHRTFHWRGQREYCDLWYLIEQNGRNPYSSKFHWTSNWPKNAMPTRKANTNIPQIQT